MLKYHSKKSKLCTYVFHNTYTSNNTFAADFGMKTVYYYWLKCEYVYNISPPPPPPPKYLQCWLQYS